MISYKLKIDNMFSFVSSSNMEKGWRGSPKFLRLSNLTRKPYQHFFCLTHTILWAVVKRCCNRTYVSLSLHIVSIYVFRCQYFAFASQRVDECDLLSLFVFCVRVEIIAFASAIRFTYYRKIWKVIARFWIYLRYSK